MNCPYCKEDKDGYWTCIDKNGHVFVYYSGLLGKYMLSIHYYKEKLEIPINYCPMCGRELRRNETYN